MLALPKPFHIQFGSGPTRKVATEASWADLHAVLGVSHRGTAGLALLQQTQALLREILQIPEDYRIALIGGGGTGAMEFLLWNLLGPKPVTLFSAGVFGDHWVHDVKVELNLKEGLQVFQTEPGESPDFKAYDSSSDCVFVWNETTAGTQVPNADWIFDHRSGLTLCDAVSAAFCVELPWSKLDAVAFSWQKGLGGEGGLGSVVLSPRAIERLQTYHPQRPMPRLFRIPREKGSERIAPGFFEAQTINTVSLLTVQDMKMALEWAQKQGSLPGLIQRVQEHFLGMEKWVEQSEWGRFLITDPSTRSKSSVCLVPCDFEEKKEEKWAFLKKMTGFLEKNRAALDVLNHAASIPALRIWLGPTISQRDLELLFPWLDAAYEDARASQF